MGKNGTYAKFVSTLFNCHLYQVLNWVWRIQSEESYSPTPKEELIL